MRPKETLVSVKRPFQKECLGVLYFTLPLPDNLLKATTKSKMQQTDKKCTLPLPDILLRATTKSKLQQTDKNAPSPYQISCSGPPSSTWSAFTTTSSIFDKFANLTIVIDQITNAIYIKIIIIIFHCYCHHNQCHHQNHHHHYQQDLT